MNENKIKISDRRWLIVTAVLGLLVLAASVYPASDPDIYIMLATGRYVAQTGHAPAVDLWSHTAYGQPWPMHEWLSSLLFYGLFTLFGINGIILFKALALVLAFFLGLQIMRLRGVSPPVALLTSVMALLVVNYAFDERIQVISFVFFMAALYILELFRAGKIKQWFFLPLTAGLFLVWANLHLGYVIGLGLYGLALFDGLLTGFTKKDWGFFKWSAIALVLAFLVTGINPYGFGLTVDSLKTLVEPVSKTFDLFIGKAVIEFQPLLSPGFSREPFVVYGLIWIGFSGLGLLINIKKTRISEWLLYAVFVYLAFWVTRYLWFLVWLTFPFTAVNWQGARETILPKIKKRPFGNAQGRKTKTSPERGKKTGLLNGMKNPGNVAFVVLVLLILTGAAMFQRKGQHLWQRIRLGWRARISSDQGAQFLKQNRGQGNVFNDFDIGGYLLWQQIPVFSDGRIAPYMKTQVLQDQQKIFSGQLQLLDKYNIDWLCLPYAIASETEAFDKFTRDIIAGGKWILVYWDDGWLIYVRNTEKYKGVTEKYRSRYVNPVTPDFSLSPELFFSELEIKMREHPDQTTPYLLAGNYWFARNDIPRALPYMERLIKMDPSNASFYNNLGNAYQQAGRIDEAIGAYKKAVAIDVTMGIGYCNWGYIMENRGELKQAIKLYTIATKVTPGDPWPYNRLGIIEMMRGNRQKAAEYWRKGAEIDPNSDAATNIRRMYEGY